MTDFYYLPDHGTPKSQLPTPSLLVDLSSLEFNLACMAGFFSDKPAKLRPHFKTHKCPNLAWKQMKAGAVGLTCAKLGEAEVLVEAGIPSILIANQIVDPLKLARLAKLALRSEIVVAVDNPENLMQISTAVGKVGSLVGIVVEVDVGLKRCGVQPGEAALSLARRAMELPGLKFKGLLGYEGHTMFEMDAGQREENVRQSLSALVDTADLMREAGMAVEIVSCGGTGTYNLSGIFPGVTEIEAGSYVFMDTKYNQLGLPFRQALRLLATVISVPVPGRAVIDAGIKVLTTENGLPEVAAPRGVRLVRLNEEHGILEVSPKTRLVAGDRVEIIPSHVCTTVNLHDRYYVMQRNRLVETWPISGRGKSQ